ncbi:MAG: HAD hydrolase-like protein [Gemmatimonadetes bacterium]|nr:HAD hydrolase-like protein [Gemmatimonadota bacterium]
MKVRLAVLDMVGTTIRSGDEIPASFREAFSSIGVELSDEAIATMRGRSKQEAITQLLLEHGVNAESLPEVSGTVYARFKRELREALRSTAKPIPGSKEVFGFLKRVGTEVVLTTGLDHQTTQALIQGLGWEDVELTGVISGDDVLKGRPAPDLIHAAMELAKVEDPGAVLVVGDTTADLEAAAQAGVGWSVGVLTGAHSRVRLEPYPHSVILASVADLPRWLSKAAGIREHSPKSHEDGS